MKDCPFCDYEGPSRVLKEFGESYVIEPLRQITPGHVLVVPREHVTDFASRPMVTAKVFHAASQWWRIADGGNDCNLITSKGAAATQTVEHFHVHVVPRSEGDGLKLPWAHPFPSLAGVPIWMGEKDLMPYGCPVCGSMGTGLWMPDHIAEAHSPVEPEPAADGSRPVSPKVFEQMCKEEGFLPPDGEG